MLEDGGFISVEDLVRAVGSVRASLEAEQEKLAGVVKSLACGGVRSEGVGSGGVEEVEVSEEWLGSLRERKKVCRCILYYVTLLQLRSLVLCMLCLLY